MSQSLPQSQSQSPHTEVGSPHGVITVDSSSQPSSSSVAHCFSRPCSRGGRSSGCKFGYRELKRRMASILGLIHLQSIKRMRSTIPNPIGSHWPVPYQLKTNCIGADSTVVISMFERCMLCLSAIPTPCSSLLVTGVTSRYVNDTHCCNFTKQGSSAPSQAGSQAVRQSGSQAVRQSGSQVARQSGSQAVR
jgi:hypothetical protein